MSMVNLLIFLGLCEFSVILTNKNIQISLTRFVFFGLLIGISSYFWGDKFFFLIILVGVLVNGIIQLIKNKLNDVIENLSSFLLGWLYVAVFFSFLILIRELPKSIGIEYRIGGFWVIFLFICLWLTDTLAYFIGAPWGKHKILPGISPKKSWEGAMGGIIGAILSAFLAKGLFLKDISLFSLIPLSILIGVFGQVGDFVESSFKRTANLKDSSHIIPGHGGILDRFDSLLFSAPLVYYYLRFVLYR